MGKFRKKPVVVEAVRVSGVLRAAKNNWSALPQWFRDAYDNGELLLLNDGVDIRTLEGMMHGEMLDWIICGVNGELYPCKPDIFAKTYEPVGS